MKYCPSCETRFDDDVMRFCTKDGTPLIDEQQPNFVAMPSEELPEQVMDDTDDAGEVTVVRRNIPVPPPPSMDDEDFSDANERPPDRIVVPTTPEQPADPFRPRTAATYHPPPRQNTLAVVALTIFGTIIVLGLGAGLFWLLQKGRATNTNANFNANLNANQNANLGIDTNFNFNNNVSLPSATPNANFNFNANVRTPTPSPTATPTPRPSPSVTPTPGDIIIEPATPRPTPNTESRPRTTPTPSAGPTLRPTPRPTPHTFATP